MRVRHVAAVSGSLVECANMCNTNWYSKKTLLKAMFVVNNIYILVVSETKITRGRGEGFGVEGWGGGVGTPRNSSVEVIEKEKKMLVFLIEGP